MNKKKIIIISAVVLMLIILAIVCVVVFGGDKKETQEPQTQEKTTEQEEESLTEQKETKETETTSEVEPTTEEQTPTEQPTTSHKEPETYLDEDGVPHIKQEETTKGNGTYTYGQDIKNIDDAIAYFESLGYTFKDKANYNISVEEVNTIYKDFSHIMTSKELEGFLNLGPNLALLTLAQHSLPSDPNVEAETKKEPSGYFVEDSYKKPDSQDEKETTKQEEVDKTPEILQWIKSNYGDKFTYNDLTYIYNDEEKHYYAYKKAEPVHMMTSDKTSKLVTVYKGDSIKTINQMGLILGCTSAVEKDEWELGFGGYTIYNENFESVSFKENTKKYMKKTGCEERISEWCNWDFMTSEGIPVSIYDDGYINIKVLYPNSTEKVSEKFTIEEYYEFLNKYEDKYYIDKQTGKRGWQGSEWEDFIDKWVVIQE